MYIILKLNKTHQVIELLGRANAVTYTLLCTIIPKGWVAH